MTTTARVRRSQILSMALALGLAAAPAAFAELPAPKGTLSIKNVVKTGDIIAVTRWSGGKVKGQVAEATECSVLVRAEGKWLEIPHAAIKTVRRYPPSQQEPGAKAMLGVVERCDRIDCAPATLAVIGVAALFKGFKDLGRHPKIVYRGTRGQASPPTCSAGHPITTTGVASSPSSPSTTYAKYRSGPRRPGRP